ncbi:MAG: cyclic nucleotide-binding domain-containing protein [Verrucomicrobiota bacterium]
MEILPAIGFANKLSENTRKILSTFGEFKEYESGENIIKQLELHPYMYVLLEGSAEVYYRGFKGEIMASQLSEGASFGEFSMLFDQCASASIRSTSKIKVWRIRQKDYQIFATEAPGAAHLILTDILRQLGDRLRNAGQMIVGNTIIQEAKKEDDEE